MTQSSLRSTLCDTLRRASETVDVPADPWPGFAQRERRHRRTRRTRAVVLAAVVAAAAAIQTNAVPLPGWAPAVAVASPWRALAEEPPRGTLASDQAWLTAFQDRVTGIHDAEEGFWAVADRDQIHVLYASDEPGRRVALVLVPLRLGIITRPELVWYEGPAGAAPQQMTDAGNEDAGNPVATLTQADAERGGFAVVVGPSDSTVTISGDPYYSASGVVERSQLATSDGTGVGVAILPPTPSSPDLEARVTRGAEVLYEGIVAGGWSSATGGEDLWQPTADQLAEAVRDSRGPETDPAVLARFIEIALSDSHLPAAGTTIRLRWSGTVNGQAAVLLTLQPPGGGVIAYAMHGDMRGDVQTSRTDLRLLLPAEDADRRPLGWRLRAEGGDDRTDRVMVATPAGTDTAAVTIGGGSPVPITLDASGAGMTSVPPDQAATVTAYAADGTIVGSTPIPPFEFDMSRRPGDTPETRIVP